MANTNPTTIPADAISQLLGWFLHKIEPHLPADLPEHESDELNDIVGELFQEHVEPMELPAITPAAAFIALKAIEAADSCHALDPISQAMVSSGYLSNKLAHLIARSNEVHTKSDLLARVDWLIADMNEFASGYMTPDAEAALKQIRFDVLFLVPDRAVCDNRPVERDLGPTVGEVKAVEAAFAAIGRSVVEAHAALGLGNMGEPV